MSADDAMVSIKLLTTEDCAQTRVTAWEGTLLHLLAEGCSNAQIALRVGRSEKTVRNRLSLLYQKLGVRNRAAAVAVWLRHGARPAAEPLAAASA